MKVSLFLLLFALCGYKNIKAQEEERESEETIEDGDVNDRAKIPCQTRDNKAGYCLSIVRCRRLMSNIRRFRNPNICFFRGDMPHVCCPARSGSRPQRPSQPRPPPRPVEPRPPPRPVEPRPPSRPVDSRPPSRPVESGPAQPLNIGGRTKIDINLPGCGKRIYEPAQGSSFVVGGREAEKYSWPWMAAIRVKSFGQNTGFLCGGSLISPRHVLTAAHCFDGQLGAFRQPSDYTIVLGSHYRASDTPNSVEEEEGIVTVKPADIKLHEAFDSKSNDNDVAVITLDRNVNMTDRVRIVCLPSRTNPADSANVTVIGWGDTSYGGVGSKSLQEAVIKVVSYSQCRTLFRRIPSIHVTNNMLCAGDLSGKKDSCQNDSGGPLMSQNVRENKWTQVGIVSFGYRCAERGFPGLYTKVVNLVPWIEKQVRGLN